MVELVDSVDLGSTAKSVQVRVLLPAPYRVFITDLRYEHSFFMDFFHLVGEGGFDCLFCKAKQYGKNPSADWFCQHATGMLDLNGFESLPRQTKTPPKRVVFLLGGGRWIRTTEAISSRFTVCPLWPLGNSPRYSVRDGTCL